MLQVVREHLELYLTATQREAWYQSVWKLFILYYEECLY
jgi:hypothetical protein